MNLFNPRTFSTDWEVMVVDKLERCLDTEKLLAFAGVLSQELDYQVHIDWMTLEFAMGINSSLDQIWERIRTVTDRAAQLVREFDCELFPAGAHPRERMFNASHIHVGTLYDETMGIHLENQMMQYAPVFGALAANSPTSNGRRGEFKSYRIRHLAHGDIRPSVVRDPQLTQMSWNGDALPKLFGATTMEVRIVDCASSRRLLAEVATLVAAYVHYQGTRVEQRQPSAQEYQDYLSNRWAAARHGLQATFLWHGGTRPVAEILDEMMDECAEELNILGVRRSDLQIINMMIQKRVGQADFVLDLAQRYEDPWCLASAYSKLARHWDVFENYLEKAPALEPMLALDDEAILEVHLEAIGEGTHFYRSREAMHYPPTVADAMIERLVHDGRIQREVTENRGILLHRVS